jgi:hypothetical protein
MLVRTLVISFAMVAAGRAACTSPGHERWDIKVSLPADSAIAKSKTVELASLVKLPNPPNAKNKDKAFESDRIPSFHNPLNLAEGDLVTIKGFLFLIATEGNDCEYHIQLAGKFPDVANASSSNPVVLDDCIVVEVALPKDISDSKLSEGAASVRQWVHDKLKITSRNKPAEPSANGSMMQHAIFVSVTGQLFFDNAHLNKDGTSQPRGKRGLQTGTLWELHPIYKIAFTKQ